ncbi:MAG: hypothetical protein CMN01_06255 [Rickettsiales bacterium]|nr:hypothetical protein [Rickettsiales bacterium]
MIAEFGIFFLIISLVLSGFAGTSFVYNFSKENFEIQNIFQKKICELFFISVLISFSCLSYSFLYSDFSLEVVTKNSNSQLPLIYKFTGVWGNHEGSILLWLLVMSLFGFLFSRQKTKYLEFQKNALGTQNILCFLVCSFVVFTSNPFQKNFPPSVEGADLNPLLQDPGLVIHPPFLYLGYVGFSIVYSISVGVLLSSDKKFKFIEILKPWVLISWICLTCGIGLGSWWAYYELGWGGFWFWDPVENASLLPWLTASALMHTIVIAEKKNVFLNWTIILSLITFSLSLLGTFLVRSGVLVSVHAFASDPTRGIFIILLLILVSGFGIFLYLKNMNYFINENNVNFFSREGAISVNNIFLISLSFTILIGTIYPIFSSIIFKSKISVGAPFFNSILTPVMIPLIFGMIIGPFLRWGKDDIYKLALRIKEALFFIILVSIVIWYLNYKGPVLSILFFILSSWICVGSITEIIENVQNNLKLKKKRFLSSKVFSQSIAHIGIALVIFGATGTSILKEENIQFQEINEAIKVDDYDVTFLGVERVVGPNYLSQMGKFEVSKNNKIVKVLKPEKRFYNSGNQITTEASILTTFKGDLYIAIGEKNLLDDDAWTTRIWFNPYTVWIWIGVVFLVLGVTISLIRSTNKL